MSRAKVKSQTIKLPHLVNYRVRIRVTTDPAPGFPNAAARCERNSQFASTIYLRPGAGPFIVAHEIMHVLSNICADFGMEFVRESEHMAYLMQFLLGTIFGYEWGE